MKQPPFLSRISLGQPNYFIIAMVAAFLVALIPTGVHRALRGMDSRAEPWAGPGSSESSDLQWCNQKFGDQQTVIVSWDGCTLANTEKLTLLAKKLAAIGTAAGEANGTGPRLVDSAISGPDAIALLTRPPLGLTFEEAAARLEGTLVGPRSRNAPTGVAGDRTRATCLAAQLTNAAVQDESHGRDAIAQIAKVAESECGISPWNLHFGGPIVEQMAIAQTAVRGTLWWGLAGCLAAIAAGWLVLRSWRLSMMCVGCAALAGATSLALVYYGGAFEVLALDRPGAKLGVLDGLSATLPTASFVLALAYGLRLVHAYRAARELGRPGAVELAVRQTFPTTLVGALVFSAIAASWALGQTEPTMRFGLFAALSAAGSLAISMIILPVLLHRFPDPGLGYTPGSQMHGGRLGDAFRRVVDGVVIHPMPALAISIAALVLAAFGIWQTPFTASRLRIMDDSGRVARDRQWIAANIGGPTQFDVVVAIGKERRRSSDDSAESDGQQYRMTLNERIELVAQVGRRLASLSQISGVLSPAIVASPRSMTEQGEDDAAIAALAKSQQHALKKLQLLLVEAEGARNADDRELWRIEARIAQSGKRQSKADYEDLVRAIRGAVDPPLLAAQQRDSIVRALHERGQQLAGSRVCILFRGTPGAETPPSDSQEAALANLLLASGVASKGVSYYNLAVYEQPQRKTAAEDQEYRKNSINALAKQDGVILCSAASDPAASALFAAGAPVIDVTEAPSVEVSTIDQVADDGSPRPVRAVLASLDSVEQRAESNVLARLPWILGAAIAIAFGSMVILARDFIAGGIATAAITLPIAALAGISGWFGATATFGAFTLAMMSVGLGLDATAHLLAAYRRLRKELPTRLAALQTAASEANLPALRTAAICGLAGGLLGFAGYTPLEQIGLWTMASLGLMVAGTTVVLPAAMASPAWPWFEPAMADESQTPAGAPTKAAANEPTQVLPAEHHATRTDAPSTLAPHSIRPAAANLSAADRENGASGPHAALHSKLQHLRHASGRE